MKNIVKTIIFEQFNEEKIGLTGLLEIFQGDEAKLVGLSDKQFEEIEKEFGVRNFEEFLEKFAPTIYPVMTPNGAYWTMDQSKASSPKGIKLDMDYKPLRLLISIMEKRGTSNQSKLEFDWQDALQEILPSSQVDDAKSLRRQFEYTTRQLLEIEETLGENSPQYKEATKKVIECRKKIAKIYKENLMNLLPLAIEDCRKKLNLLEVEATSDVVEENTLKLGYHEFDENGDIRFIEASKEDSDREKASDTVALSVSNKVKTWIETDYDNVMGEKSNVYVRELTLSTFSNAQDTSLIQMDRYEIEKQYKERVQLYETMLEGQFKSLNEIFSKILGIKAYFDQIPSKDKTLTIIANETCQEIVKRKELLEIYLDNISDKEYISDQVKYKANIWLGIIPNVNSDSTEGEVDSDLDAAINFDDEFDIGNDTDKITNIGATVNLLALLENKEIISFFNFKADKTTAFEQLQSYGVNDYMSKLEKVKKKSEFMIPCYPNFTVIDKEDFRISVKHNGDAIYLDGVYIDASYVGAGLVASYLNPDNLLDKRYGFKKEEIYPEYAGVRIDLEKRNLSEKIRTTIGKESSTGLNSSVKDEVYQCKKGMIFTCDSQNDTMYVLLCRSLSEKSLYQTLTKLYLKKKMTEELGRLNMNKLKNGFKRQIENDRKDKDYINNILVGKDELITPEEGDEPIFRIKFDKGEETFEVQINDD